MPANLIKYAVEHGISKDKAENAWNDAKAIVCEKGRKEEDLTDKDWALVTTIFKKKLGLNEEFIPFTEYVKKYFNLMDHEYEIKTYEDIANNT